MHQLKIKVEVFKEDDLYVALCPSLNVSSFGESIDEAKKALVDAVEIFIEECSEMGTLDEVLEESGFTRKDQGWLPRQAVSEEHVALVICRINGKTFRFNSVCMESLLGSKKRVLP